MSKEKMDGCGRVRSKKDRNRWLDRYNLWSREVAWSYDGGKNFCRVDKARRKAYKK